MSLNRIVSCLLVFSGVAIANHPGFAKKQPAFQDAKVISQDIQSHQVDRGAMTGTPLVRYSNTVVLETAHERMTWVEVSSYAAGTRTQVILSCAVSRTTVFE